MAWVQVKGYIKEHNTLFTLAHVKEVTHAGFHEVSAEDWRKLVKHTQEVEDKFWEDDGLQETFGEEFIICIGGCDFESSDDTDDSSTNTDSDDSFGSSDSD